MILCSLPECQTTAGCMCPKRVSMSYPNADLNRVGRLEAEVAALRARCEKAEAEVAEAKASRDLQARIASDEEGLSRAAESRCAELDRRIAETRAAALEEAAELATTCIDPAGRCKCSTAYEIAAAIRALIPEQKEG